MMAYPIRKKRYQFVPGDTVVVNKPIDNKPNMVVDSIVNEYITKDKENENKPPKIAGIRCYWFTTTGELVKAIFDFKDLDLVKSVKEKE